MITYEELREKYPNPVTVDHVDDEIPMHDKYCVGAAFYREYLYDTHASPLELADVSTCFPDYCCVATALQYRNPTLIPAHAELYAVWILFLNDDSHFDLAWDIVRDLSVSDTLSDETRENLTLQYGIDFYVKLSDTTQAQELATSLHTQDVALV